MYIAYLSYTPFSWIEFGYGQLIGVLFLVGKQALTLAYAKGPGGPVNAIITTQSLYQVLLDVYVAGQQLGAFGIAGFLVGLAATFCLTLGNMAIKKCLTKEQYEGSPLRRFL